MLVGFIEVKSDGFIAVQSDGFIAVQSLVWRKQAHHGKHGWPNGPSSWSTQQTDVTGAKLPSHQHFHFWFCSFDDSE